MLGIAPTDLIVHVNGASSMATLDFTLASWKNVQVFAPSGEELLVISELYTKDGPLRQLFSFLTDTDGIYVVKNNENAFCLPFLGRLYACRNDSVLRLPTCDCHTELEKSLRTLDVLSRCVVALANEGDKDNAQQLYELASTLCPSCTCCDD